MFSKIILCKTVHIKLKIVCINSIIFTPQPLRAVGVSFSPMVSGWAGGRQEKFIRAVSQKLEGVGS